jgi:hypothetical protein
MASKFHWGVNKTLSQSPDIKNRLSALSQIVFTPEGITDEMQYTCAKLTIGRKYYIARTKSLIWLQSHLNDVLKSYNMNGVADMYLPIVKHVHETGYYEIKVDIICQDENPYNVIKAEFLALKGHVGNKLCLNKNEEPYTPKFNSKTNMFGWLTVNQFLNFKKLVKAHSNSM